MNLFNRVKEGVTGTVKNLISKLDDAAKSFMKILVVFGKVLKTW